MMRAAARVLGLFVILVGLLGCGDEKRQSLGSYPPPQAPVYQNPNSTPQYQPGPYAPLPGNGGNPSGGCCPNGTCPPGRSQAYPGANPAYPGTGPTYPGQGPISPGNPPIPGSNGGAANSPLSSMFGKYDQIRRALSEDRFNGIDSLIVALDQEVDRLPNQEPGRLQRLKGATRQLRTAQGNDGLRSAFGEVSRILVELYRESGLSSHTQYHCDMANADWLQPQGEAMGNPYMGTRMRNCGTRVDL